MKRQLNPGLCFALLLGAVLISPTSPKSQADIIIDGYTANTNDRFTNNAAFIGAGLNFSGVGQDGSGRWATAISRNVVISAAHFPPSGTVNFYATNDSSSLVTRSIVASTQIFGTDLYLGVLDSNLPSSITHYSFATQPIMGTAGFLTNASVYQSLNTYMFGRSPVAHPAWQDQAVGRNRITGYLENSGFNGNTDADSLLMFYEANSSPDYVQYESYLQVGDSGAPLFVDIGGGNLVLLGTNAFINTGGLGGSPPFFSGINYTGNQATAITNIINSVPEPSSLLLVALGQLGLILRRRRRSA
jgi:hypothetical protein